MTTSAHTRRLFFALWPDRRTRAALAERRAGLAGSPITDAKLHLTLVFLGPQAAAAVPGLRALLHAVPAGPLTLELDRYGAFDGARVAWAGMRAPPAELLALQRWLALASRPYRSGADEERAYLPHVSLTRATPLSAPASVPLPAEMAPLRWLARHLVLVESAGDLYRVIGSRRLSSRGG